MRLSKSGTDLISLLILLLLFSEATVFKKPKAPSFQMWSVWNLTGFFFK